MPKKTGTALIIFLFFSMLLSCSSASSHKVAPQPDTWWSNLDLMGHETDADSYHDDPCPLAAPEKLSHPVILEDENAMKNHLHSLVPQHLIPQDPASFQTFRNNFLKHFHRALSTELLPPAGTAVSSQSRGVHKGEGWLVEKLFIQPFEGTWVPSLYFLPSPMGKDALPGVLVLHGHDQPGKTHDDILALAINLAKRGAAVLVPEWYGFGELSHNHWKHINVQGNFLAGISMNHPINTSARRFVDWLSLRPEVDPSRLGATGHSGGGENTLYLGAIDERIIASAIVDGIDDWHFRLDKGLSRCPEHYPINLLPHGDNAVILAMHAPKQTLVLSGQSDFIVSPSSVIETMVQRARAAFVASGAPNSLKHLPFSGGHRLSRPKREAIMDFFAEAFDLPELAGLEEEISVDKSSLKVGSMASNKTILDTVRELILKSKQEKKMGGLGAHGLAQALGIVNLPEFEAISMGDKGYLLQETGPPLPYEYFQGSSNGTPVLCFADFGRQGCDSLVAAMGARGQPLMLADVSGWGELEGDWPWDDGWKRIRLANFTILAGQPLMVMRLKDLSILVSYLRAKTKADRVLLVGVGPHAVMTAFFASSLLKEVAGSLMLGSPIWDPLEEYLTEPVFPMPVEIYLEGFAGMPDFEEWKTLEAGKRLMLNRQWSPDEPLSQEMCRFLN